VSDGSTTGVLSTDKTMREMKNFGRATLADFFGDLVIYRNLEPLERRLQGLKAAAYKIGISNERIPRKQDPDYAKAAVWFGQQAQRLRKNSTPLSEILFVGDTLYNDGQAFANMQAVSEWDGACFIGSEKLGDPYVADIDEEEHVFCTNRWGALADWVKWVLDCGLHVDGRTLVIVDIDKTALGAKGRNDQVINEARLEGIFRTMDAVLGDNFDRSLFERQYAELNRARYHFLTEDNQDYLAYICLVLNAGLIDYEEILNEIEQESLDNFEQFLRWVDSRLMIRPQSGESLRQVHEAVIGAVRVGDPTPFKRFRRQEFITTVERMGNLPDDAPIAELLDGEITLTNEVCELTEWLRQRGCLLLCLSDKPDEASTPDSHSEEPMLPVHRVPTHRVGATIAAQLATLG
jgi:phosphoglycolate phosphatase-like HAD superfamily hydrolase